jgi:hypothetical protein
LRRPCIAAPAKAPGLPADKGKKSGPRSSTPCPDDRARHDQGARPRCRIQPAGTCAPLSTNRSIARWPACSGQGYLEIEGRWRTASGAAHSDRSTFGSKKIRRRRFGRSKPASPRHLPDTEPERLSPSAYFPAAFPRVVGRQRYATMPDPVNARETHWQHERPAAPALIPPRGRGRGQGAGPPIRTAGAAHRRGFPIRILHLRRDGCRDPRLCCVVGATRRRMADEFRAREAALEGAREGRHARERQFRLRTIGKRRTLCYRARWTHCPALLPPATLQLRQARPRP